MCAFVVVFIISDFPFLRSTPDKNINQRAVIAIRDDVNTFQKFGSRLFTTGYTENAYNESVYITQYSANDKKDFFLSELLRLLKKYPEVDIFILAHGNQLIYEIGQLDAFLLRNIRLIYNTGCGNFNQGDYAISIGADAYMSHYGQMSMSPVFYFYFLRNWSSGMRLDESCDDANEMCVGRLNWIYAFSENKSQVINDTKAIITGDESISVDE
ncbi:MAG: hypothetical protein A2W91_02810 [Bacteroidetes bacterium GWF2_38_335]|nr:MAG: hypothetical protein A2W91_02810 [Bacteroidetes bacterium GWF2_38_335]OFY77575.1 MAG: hypothetical protein A2281_01950 [Bacteroidetes bacterium RIFOXYA12_FULL_38_20]HBS87124.1 hypothetical protein [Bacteroidales bacterium]